MRRFPPEPHNGAENGGGGNRTRVTFPRVSLYDTVLARDGDSCFYCGKRNWRGYHLDHVVAKSRGGRDGVENRVLACAPCNVEKATHPVWLYVLLRELGPVPARLSAFGQRDPHAGDAWLRGDWAVELHDRIHEQLRAVTEPPRLASSEAAE
jgi:hypothetical protein